MTRTLALAAGGRRRGRTGRRDSTRSRRVCRSNGMSPISSRNSVPPSACSKRPRRIVCAPVKAPRSWPNSSRLEQVLRDRRGVDRDERAAARAGCACAARAPPAPCPMPDSPVISTVTLLCDSRPMARNTSCIAGAWPSISGASAHALVGDFLAQALVDRAADQLHRRGHVERLGQVFEGAALERRHRAVEVGEGGHDDDRQARMLAP